MWPEPKHWPEVGLDLEVYKTKLARWASINHELQNIWSLCEIWHEIKVSGSDPSFDQFGIWPWKSLSGDIPWVHYQSGKKKIHHYIESREVKLMPVLQVKTFNSTVRFAPAPDATVEIEEKI